MIEDLKALLGRTTGPRLIAKIVGGASMFPGAPGINIGVMNQNAVETILSGLGIPILARDVGGDTGRRLTLDTASGVVSIRLPGGACYDI
jgi:chemotaxis protein CheD